MKKKNWMMITSFVGVILAACIGDDIVFDTVEPTLRILNPISSLELGTSYQFEVSYFNETGAEESVSGIQWASTSPMIIDITDGGEATAHEIGSAIIIAEYNVGGQLIMVQNEIVVGDETIAVVSDRSGTIMSTSSYLLEGEFNLKEENGILRLSFNDNYRASTALPGLYVYLSNNPNSIADAYEIGEVQVFEGVHAYEIRDNIGINDFDLVLYYCKPFNVKVGDGEIN